MVGRDSACVFTLIHCSEEVEASLEISPCPSHSSGNTRTCAQCRIA